MESNEDSKDQRDFSYGGGSKEKSKSKKSKKKAQPVQKIGLKAGDPNYPSDMDEDDEGNINFDWTEIREGVVREVVNQGNRRTCWTIASSRSLGGRLVAERRFDHHVRLSALHLLVGLIDKVESTGGLQNLEHLRRFLMDYGDVLEDDCNCPQLALDLKNDDSKPDPVLCTEKGKAKAKQTRTYKVQDLIILDKVDEKQLIALVKKGPVAVSIDVYKEFLEFKGDGIYKGPKRGSNKIDKHMFLVYGFGTEMSEGIHYWKVQNSAGPKWGNNGFGKIIRQVSRGPSARSLFTCVVYPELLDHYEGQNNV